MDRLVRSPSVNRLAAWVVAVVAIDGAAMLGACAATPVDDDGGPIGSGVVGDAGPREDGGGADDGGGATLDGGANVDGGGPNVDGGARVDGGGADGGGAVLDGGGAGVDGGAGDGGDGGWPIDLAGVDWIHGAPNCNTTTDPPLQVVAYDETTFVLRQSKCVNYEGPFMYLLIGSAQALLVDTGATSSSTTFPLYANVRLILDDVAPDVDLVVVHSHGHGDHTAADGQFVGQAGVTVVAATVSALTTFFGIADWPDDAASIDLGGRVVDVVPIPGHQSAHIGLYDRRTALLLTGDALYPGRLYVSDWSTYVASIDRLVAFLGSAPVAAVLGAHVEMSTTPGDDYPIGATNQPNEHALPLSKTHLLELRDALGAQPAYDAHADFIIYPL